MIGYKTGERIGHWIAQRTWLTLLLLGVGFGWLFAEYVL